MKVILLPVIQFLLYLSSDTPGMVKNAYNWRDFSSNILTTFWDPLPSLDLTDIDPEIVYIRELFKITCGQNTSMNHMVVAGNNATMESLDLTQIYKAVITARNNVAAAVDGPSVEIRGKQQKYNFMHRVTTIIIYYCVFGREVCITRQVCSIPAGQKLSNQYYCKSP